MANAFMGLEAYKNVAQSADKVIEFAANNPDLQAQAYNLKGIAIQKQSEGKKSEEAARSRGGLAPGRDGEGGLR